MVLVAVLIPDEIVEAGRLPEFHARIDHVVLGRLVVVEIGGNLLSQRLEPRGIDRRRGVAGEIGAGRVVECFGRVGGRGLRGDGGCRDRDREGLPVALRRSILVTRKNYLYLGREDAASAGSPARLGGRRGSYVRAAGQDRKAALDRRPARDVGLGPGVRGLGAEHLDRAVKIPDHTHSHRGGDRVDEHRQVFMFAEQLVPCRSDVAGGDLVGRDRHTSGRELGDQLLPRLRNGHLAGVLPLPEIALVDQRQEPSPFANRLPQRESPRGEQDHRRRYRSGSGWRLADLERRPAVVVQVGQNLRKRGIVGQIKTPSPAARARGPPERRDFDPGRIRPIEGREPHLVREVATRPLAPFLDRYRPGREGPAIAQVQRPIDKRLEAALGVF